MDIPLKFAELHEGMEIEDFWFTPGKVIKCSDVHNVLIEFDNGGSELYCMANDCEDRDPTPIYRKIIRKEIIDNPTDNNSNEK